MHVIRNCPSCGTETRCSKREFSEQAWAVLVVWGEIEESVVDQSVCQPCYEELRDILIDRQGEMENTLKNPKSVQRAPADHSRSNGASVAKKADAKKEVHIEPAKAPAASKKSAAPAVAAKKTDKADKSKKTKRAS